MKEEIQFNKYEKRGSDYHYSQINILNPFKFNAFVHARYIKQIKILRNLLKNYPEKSKTLRILDLGCGDGVLLFIIKKYLKNYNFEIYGIDLSEEAIKTAKLKIPEGNFFVAGVYDTNFQNDFFDIIISSDVIEHVNYPEKMVKEIHRTAKKDALIIIGTPVRYTEHPLDKMHVHEFFPNEFKNLFARLFTETKIIKSHGLYYLLRYRRTLKIYKLEIRWVRYFYYLLSVFNFNPFLKPVKKTNELYAYMFVSAKKDNKK